MLILLCWQENTSTLFVWLTGWLSQGRPDPDQSKKLMFMCLFSLPKPMRSRSGKPNQRKVGSWTFAGASLNQHWMWIVLVFQGKPPEFTKQGEIHELSSFRPYNTKTAFLVIFGVFVIFGPFSVTFRTGPNYYFWVIFQDLGGQGILYSLRQTQVLWGVY